MPKSNKDKMNRDLQALATRLSVIAHFTLAMVVSCIFSLVFCFSIVVFGGFLRDSSLRSGLPAFMLVSAGLCAPLFLNLFERHYRWLNSGRSLIEDVKRLGKTDRDEGKDVREYLFYASWQFLAVMGVADIVGFLAYEVFGTDLFWLWAIVGASCCVIFLWYRSYSHMTADSTPTIESSTAIRGTVLNSFLQAKANAIALLARLRTSAPNRRQYLIRWAGIDLPGNIESHFGLVGINGSGKTLALQALMRSVIPTVRDADSAATARRALVFDPENKFIPFLQALAGEENVLILNPFDKRSRPWDLANDIEDLATAQEMASIFIAEQKGDSQPFWQRTARGILSAVLKSLHMKAPGKWTLRHVFHIVTNEPRLTAVLRATDQTQGLIDLLRPTQQTLFNVLTELRSHMDMLELIAALWDKSVKVHGKKPFTLKKWIAGQSVLVFGRPTQLEDTVLALNRVLIKRASQLIRAPMPKEELDARGRTWIFLDELRNIGNLPGLDKLLTEGRSRGARVVIAFQDIDGLREVYTERIAEEIANQCDTMSYLRCRGTTAKWAAERLGRCEYWDKDFHTGKSTTYSDSTSNTESSGSNTRKNLTDAVLESQLSGLPPVEKHIIDGIPGGYIQGWHVVPAIECIYPAREKEAWYPFEEMEEGERFAKRFPEDQILRPWSDETDWEELGFTPILPPEPIKMPDVDSLRG